MNLVQIIGNLARDTELRYTTGANQTAVCTMTVAVNSGYGDKQRTAFVPVKVWGKRAENCDTYLSKGSKVAVTGELVTGSYEKDGQTRYTWEVNAREVEFLSKSKGNTEPAGMTTADSGNSGFGVPDGFSAVPDDELPPWM